MNTFDYQSFNSKSCQTQEKALNQFIAHHAIVFEPQKLKVWVSTSPWQLGEFVCYDLKKVFALRGMKKDQEIIDSSLAVPADSFLQTQGFKNLLAYNSIKQRLAAGGVADVDSLVTLNPQLYSAYVLAGDYVFKQQQYSKALQLYQTALTKVIATKEEENSIRKKIAKCAQNISRGG